VNADLDEAGAAGRPRDLAGQAFWRDFWNRPAGRSFSHLSFSFRTFSRLLFRYARRGTRACEVGCGASVWLPALAMRGVEAWGIDYSEVGVEMARRQAAALGATVTVVHGDVFDDTSLGADAFDLVFSLGLLEHFDDSAPLARRFRDLCRPGGYVITLVPNFAGIWGSVQQAVDRRVYDAHRVYTPADLDRAHVEAGLRPVQPAQYFGGIGPLVVNYSALLARLPSFVSKPMFGFVWTVQQTLCWGMLPLPRAMRNPASIAAHIVGVYRRDP